VNKQSMRGFLAMVEREYPDEMRLEDVRDYTNATYQI
jgi:hypothetical protein